MRRVPSCLLFAGFLLTLGVLIPENAWAESGFRHRSGAHHRSLGGHGIGRHHHKAHHRGHHRHFGHFSKNRPGFYVDYPSSYGGGPGFTAPIIVQQNQPSMPYPVPVIVPVGGAPVSASAAAGAPTFYVLNSNERSQNRKGAGAKVLSMHGDPESESEISGPRIINLNVPVGRNR